MWRWNAQAPGLSQSMITSSGQPDEAVHLDRDDRRQCDRDAGRGQDE